MNGRMAGFTYIMMLIAVVVIGIMAGVATLTMSHTLREEREKELLFRGLAYRNAIRAYYEAGASLGQAHQYPHALKDLLQDPRFLGPRHYLRALYADPIGKRWVLVYAPGGGIEGVHSPSHAHPLKTGNFPPALKSFRGATAYSQWVFSYVPPTASRKNG